MHFGATLRLLRTEGGLSLRELAERVGVSNAYLSRVENGHDRAPTPDRLLAIARALGLPAARLLELAEGLHGVAERYLGQVPAARELVFELERRALTDVDFARIKRFVEREFPLPAPTPRASELRALLTPERLVLELGCSDLADVIDVASTRLASSAGVPATLLGQAIAKRERECPSALGAGLAVPHALVAGARPAAALITLKAPLAADTPDGQPLRMCLVHVHPGGPAHVDLLLDLAHLAEDDFVLRVCRAVRASADASEILRLFER